MMPLRRLTYISAPTQAVTLALLNEITDVSVANNIRHGLSTLLVAADDAFLQRVEGPAAGIEDLMARLVEDPRHSALTVLDDYQICSTTSELTGFYCEPIGYAPVDRLLSHFDGMTKHPIKFRQFGIQRVRQARSAFSQSH